MGIRRGLRALAAVVAVSAAPAPGPAAATTANGEPTARLAIEVSDTDKARAVLGDDVVLAMPRLGTVVVEVPVDALAATVARLGSLAAGRAQLDPLVSAARVPDDPHFAEQWGPQLVRAPTAWERTTGAPSTVIAVLDTGVDPTHPDLAGAVVGGIDLLNGDDDPADDNGHGTAVAAIVAARGDNGVGVAGYCWRCSLLAVKVLDAEGDGVSSTVAAGIVWAVDHGADVVNLSLSSPSSSFPLGRAVEYALDRGVAIVAAGGNDGLVQPTYPAAYPGVVGVVATDRSDRIYRWSNRGGWAAIGAPGCHRSAHGDGYADLCGTSAATPAVAGALGLARSAAPVAPIDQLVAALLDGAEPIEAGSAGAGRLDVARTVSGALRDDTSLAAGTAVAGAPSPPRGLRVRMSAGSAALTWIEPSDPGASPVVEYVVTSSPGGEVQVVPAPRTEATVGGLLEGVTYRFAVAARNAAGTGPATSLSSPVTPSATGVARVAGLGRELTSVALSQRAFTRASAVVVARADDYADALAAAPLAATLGGPLLLTGNDGLDVAVGAEIRRLGARVAHLIGGERALSPALEQSLGVWGVTNVVRTAGRDRFDTARLIAGQVGGTSVYVANGASGWADAVAGSALAAVQGRPILLVADDHVPAATRAALVGLGVDAAIVIGGAGSVADSLLRGLADPGDDGLSEVSVSRIAGANRYETSRRLADVAVAAGADPSRAWLASGQTWPDALAAGPAIAARGGVLLLIRGDDLDSSPGAAAWLAEHARTLDEVVIVGGGGSIGERTERQVVGRLARA